MMRSFVAVIGLAASQAALANVPQGYDLTLYARSGFTAFQMPSGALLSSQPVTLDESGGIAVRFIGGSFGEGVYYGTPEGGSVVISGVSAEILYSGSIDARNGRVAVPDAAFGAGGLTIVGTDGSVVRRLNPGGPLAISGMGSPTLATDGAVCYEGDFGFVGERVVVEPEGATRVQFEVANDFDDDFTFLLTPAMNAERQVVMNTLPVDATRRIVRFGPAPDGSYPDANRDTVAEITTGSTYSSFVNGTAISSDGRVAFHARRASDGVWEVLRWDGPGQPLVKIAEGGDLGIVSGSLANFPPVVNNHGFVVFRADDATGSPALFVGDGAGLTRIVGRGDTVETDVGTLDVGFDFGPGTGVQTLNSRVDINDAGQISCGLFLENGTIGIFVAAPENFRCNLVDLAEPFGALDIADVVEFLRAFGANDPAADIAAPMGAWDIADVVEFLRIFGAGCGETD